MSGLPSSLWPLLLVRDFSNEAYKECKPAKVSLFCPWPQRIRKDPFSEWTKNAWTEFLLRLCLKRLCMLFFFFFLPQGKKLMDLQDFILKKLNKSWACNVYSLRVTLDSERTVPRKRNHTSYFIIPIKIW